MFSMFACLVFQTYFSHRKKFFNVKIIVLFKNFILGTDDKLQYIYVTCSENEYVQELHKVQHLANQSYKAYFYPNPSHLAQLTKIYCLDEFHNSLKSDFFSPITQEMQYTLIFKSETFEKFSKILLFIVKHKRVPFSSG